MVVLAWDVETPPWPGRSPTWPTRGAHYVSVLYWDQHVKRSRLEHADPDSLGYTPVWWDRHIEECIERRSASILVCGDPNPDLLSDIDPARTGRDSMPLTGPLHAMHAGGEVNWTVVPGVSSGIARRVLGTDDVDALWEVYAPILRLDADDPVQAWRDHVARLRTRAEALNACGFEALRFQGPGTDLRVGLMRGANWLAAGFETAWGREMIANMPTEEVFTTPDNRVADGTVAATRPFQLIGGPTIEGLRLRFEGGRVVEVEAERNADAVQPGSRPTRAPSAWARWRSSTEPRRSGAPGAYSTTSCSTRTPPATSRSATATASPCPTCRPIRTHAPSGASISQTSTRI